MTIFYSFYFSWKYFNKSTFTFGTGFEAKVNLLKMFAIKIERIQNDPIKNGAQLYHEKKKIV